MRGFVPHVGRAFGAVLAGFAAIGSITTAQAGTPPFTLGVYAGNPNGNSPTAEAAFETRFNSFVATMNATPKTMNAFTDFSQPPADWPANAAWTAWSWTQSKVVGHALIPVIGIPMSDDNHWSNSPAGSTNDNFFQGITAGAYDAVYQGIVDSWVSAGFPTMYLRLGYEMDGGFMPWFMGSTTAVQADWVAAFQHLAILMRARAAYDGGHAYIVWNPADINWTQLSVQSAYPGDNYVDVISSDAYSPLYPTTLYDWVLNNWTNDSSIQTWWAKPGNMRHFWTYPSANGWHPLGTGGGWGFQDSISLAQAHGKALAVSECGDGIAGSNTGPADDPVFPPWLAGELSAAKSAHLTVAYVNIWDTTMSDGNWAFSLPTDNKPLTAAAWAQSFGAPH